MIKSRQDLNRFIISESRYYMSVRPSFKDRIISALVCDSVRLIGKYLKLLRLCEYHLNNSCLVTHRILNISHDIQYLLLKRRKNKLGRILGIEIPENVFDEGLVIYHPGCIVVNGNSRVGKNCILHGCNCIGNKGTTLDAPMIGDNVTLGVGASVIGPVTIPSYTKIGAGAVVNKSFSREGMVLVGIPACEK